MRGFMRKRALPRRVSLDHQEFDSLGWVEPKANRALWIGNQASASVTRASAACNAGGERGIRTPGTAFDRTTV